MGVLGLPITPKYSILALSAPTVQCISRYKHPWVLTTTALHHHYQAWCHPVEYKNICNSSIWSYRSDSYIQILMTLISYTIYWAVQSGARAAKSSAQDGFWPVLTLWTSLPILAKIHYHISTLFMVYRQGPLPFIEWLRRKMPVPGINRPLLSLSEAFHCQFNLRLIIMFYRATLPLATLLCFYSASSGLMLQLRDKWFQRAIIKDIVILWSDGN